MDRKPRIGFIDFNDERAHVVDETLPGAQKLKAGTLSAIRRARKVNIIDAAKGFSGRDKMAWNPAIARRQTDALIKADIDAVIFNYSVWASPRLTRLVAQQLIWAHQKKGKSTPIAILTNLAPEQPGMVGGMAGAGGLDQLGISNFRIWSENLSKDKKKLDLLVNFCAFAYQRQLAAKPAEKTIERLRGQIYGEIGGRSIQIVTAEADPLQWAKVFGVDTQPIGQAEIVRRANEMIRWSDGVNSEVVEMLDRRVSRAFEHLTKHIGRRIHYAGKFNESKLKYQLACYYATEDMIKENNFDFIGVKCQTEMSEWNVTQCFTQAFSNDTVGPGGEKKKIVVCACEDDKDGAMTQQIMHLLTGLPTMFADFRHLDPKHNVLYLVNCGAHTLWFATRSEDCVANLRKTRLDPQAFFYAASGATVNFDAAPGPVTGARLGRMNGKYWMNIVPGKFIRRPKKSFATTPGWPHAFFRFNVSMEKLFQEHPCNHMQVVAGDHTAGLVEVCDRLDIGYKIQDEDHPYYKTPC